MNFFIFMSPYKNWIKAFINQVKKAKEPEAEARLIVMMNKILFLFLNTEKKWKDTILKEKIFSLMLFLFKSGDFYSGSIL